MWIILRRRFEYSQDKQEQESDTWFSLRGALFCDRANTMTSSTGEEGYAVETAIEVQDTSMVGVRRP